jgi:hypothetical protein
MTPAETTLSLLFKKLHPHLEDAAHAVAKGAKASELQRLYLKLVLARHQVVDILEPLSESIEDEALADILDTLAANLMPVGENYQQGLILTQLCLEEAPKDLLPYVPKGAVAASTWGPRMTAFLQKLEDPAFHAHARWKAIDESVGETEEE